MACVQVMANSGRAQRRQIRAKFPRKKDLLGYLETNLPDFYQFAVFFSFCALVLPIPLTSGSVGQVCKSEPEQ